MILVEWICCHYFGGHSEILFDPEDFCGNWFVTEVSKDDWDIDNVSATCPKCGCKMIQNMVFRRRDDKSKVEMSSLS